MFAPSRWCLSCEYPLSGLTSRACPECGAPFDPADPRTFQRVSHVSWWVRFHLRPRRLQTRRFRNFAMATMLWGSGGLLGGWFVLLLGCGLAGAAFFVRAATQAPKARLAAACGRAFEPETRPRWQWHALALLVLAIGFDVPARVTLFVHRPLLTRFCHRAYEVEPMVGNERGLARVGLLLVHYENRPSGMILAIGPGIVGDYSDHNGALDQNKLTLAFAFTNQRAILEFYRYGEVWSLRLLGSP